MLKDCNNTFYVSFTIGYSIVFKTPVSQKFYGTICCFTM